MLDKPRQCRLMGYVICQMTHINNQTLAGDFLAWEEQFAQIYKGLCL